MRTFTKHLQTMILMALFVFATILKANASAEAGKASVYVGKTVTISLADSYQRTLKKATDVTYQWYSESNSYATVTGSTRYTATVKGVKATSACKVYFKCSYFIDGYFRTMDFYYTITVKSTNVSVTSVTLNKSHLSMLEGTTDRLTATVSPSNATNKNVTWSSSNTYVATVSNGLVSAKSAGTATITCRAADGSGKSASCSVSVEASKVYVSNIALNKTSDNLYVGDGIQLYASVSPSSATVKSVSWASNNTSVATVTDGGYVTARSVGNATIVCTAKDGSGTKATCYITVKEKVRPSSITLNKTSDVLTEGQTLQLAATVTPYDAADKSVTWRSDNDAVATVDSKGFVTAKSAGKANISATTTNNLTAVCAITVTRKYSGEPARWTGHYTITSSHVESSPTRAYQDNFKMTVEEKDGICYVTSLFGDDLTKYNNGGFKLHDNGDGTAAINISDNNILRYTGTNNPLYAILVYDEANDVWKDSWTLSMNPDGTVSIEDFYVAAFTWEEDEKKWTNGRLEALYYKVIATMKDVTGISNAVLSKPNIHIGFGAIWLDEETYITVYRDNGMKVFSGRTAKLDNLSKGLYVVRIGRESKKVVIK
ncbi:MAG: Ig domain-containing protein [Prevotella sp.]